MVLDGVDAEPDTRWLGLARNTVAAFTTAPFCVAPDAQPHTTVARVAWPYPDRFPIGRVAGGSCLFLCLMATDVQTTAAVRHAARFASSVPCLVPDMGRADRPAPRVEGWMEGRPAAVLDGAAEEPVAVVRGRVGAVESRLTADGSRVFTVYRLVIEAVITPQARLPLAAGQTIVVSRPGGRVPQGERTAIVVVAGFGTIAVDDRVTVGVVAEAGGDGYHEVRPALPGGLGGVR